MTTLMKSAKIGAVQGRRAPVFGNSGVDAHANDTSIKMERTETTTSHAVSIT